MEWTLSREDSPNPEASLAEKLELQCRVLESMAEGVVMTDEGGIILYTNPAFEKMFGYGPGDLHGRHVFILNGGTQREHELQFLAINRHLERNPVWNGEYFNRRKDGVPFYSRARITTMDLSGHTYFISVQEDITERRRMERELLQQRDNLEKGVAARTEQLEKNRIELEARNQMLLEAHQELEVSRNRYSDLYDFAPLGYVTLDDEGTVRDINLTAASLLEVERAELIYKPFVSCLENEERQTFLDHLRRCRQGNGYVKSELRITQKRGRSRYIELFSAPLQDTEGGESLYRTAISDVTERKLADERIIRLNRLYAVLSAIGQVIVHAADRDALFQGICQVVIEHGGFRMAWIGLVDQDSLIVKPVVFSGVNEGYLDNINVSVKDESAGHGPTGSAIRAGGLYLFNDFLEDPLCIPWRDNAAKHGYRASAAIALKLNGRTIGALTMYAGEKDYFDAPMAELLQQIAADISFALDNLDREASHRTAETEYRALFEESKDVVYTMTASGQLVDINLAGSELFGYSKEELLALDIDRNLYMDHQERDSIKKKMFARGYVRDQEVRMKKKSGKELTVLVSGSVIRNERKEITGYRGIIHDITKRKQLEQQLLQAQKMESIGLLAGGVAHDFNNLLTAISGYGQIIQERFAQKDETLGMCIGQILSAAGRARELTRSLLAFGRKQIINPKPLSVNDIVINLSKLLTRLIGEDIAFSTTLGGSSVTVMADSGQIDQVIINLVANARDAMPGGGKLHIGIEQVKLDNKTAQRHDLEKGGSYALITVSDTGTGMDEQTQKRIFEPFFTTKETGKGTGLGLSINYGIVKQHGGAISVKSELGKGTVFSIYLPLVQLAVGRAPVQDASPLPGGTETILVAEDELIVATFLKTVLEMAGYTVITALDGAEAIERFRENRDRISLVLCDVVMPERNGKEVREHIRAIDPLMKVLFISGYNDEIIHMKGILLENTDFLTKPVAKQRLLPKLREILDSPADKAIAGAV